MLERATTQAATVDRAPRPSPFSFAVSRARSTVVITLHGDLDRAAAEGLTPVLRDIIDYQGNLAVVVDLRGVSAVDPAAMELFGDASGWAELHGASFHLHRSHQPLSYVENGS